MPNFTYQLPIPASCADTPHILFEDIRILDPADCVAQTAYVRSVLENVCAAPSCTLDPNQFEIFIFDDADDINAAIYCGNNILGKPKKLPLFVGRKALTTIESEDELAFLIGHEIGHPKNLKALELEDKPENFSGRLNESGADGWGAVAMVEAGYNWRASLTLIQRLPETDYIWSFLTPHGSKQNRLRTINDVLGARGIIENETLHNQPLIPLPAVLQDETFLKANHTSFLDGYKAHVGWNNLDAVQRIEALVAIPYWQLTPLMNEISNQRTISFWRAGEFITLMEETVRDAPSLPGHLAHRCADYLLGIADAVLKNDHTNKDPLTDTAMGRQILRIYDGLGRFVPSQQSTLEDVLFKPVLGPFDRLTKILDRFIHATSEADILSTATELSAFHDAIYRGHDAGHIEPPMRGVLRFLENGFIKLPNFKSSWNGEEIFPWAQHVQVFKRTQSPELLKALWTTGANSDPALWAAANDEHIEAYNSSLGISNNVSAPIILSIPQIWGYEPERCNRHDNGTRAQWLSAFDGRPHPERTFHLRSYVKMRVHGLFRGKRFTEYAADEIENNPTEFMEAYGREVKSTNWQIEHFPDAWGEEKRKAVYVERTTRLIEKITEHHAAHPASAKKRWHEAFAEKYDYEDNDDKIPAMQDYAKDDLTAFVPYPNTPGQSDQKYRYEHQRLRDGWRVDKKQLDFYGFWPRIKIAAQEASDDEEYNLFAELQRSETTRHDSPLAAFVIDDPLKLFTLGEKLYVLEYLKIEPTMMWDDDRIFAWAHEKLGYRPPHNPQQLRALSHQMAYEVNKNYERPISVSGPLFYSEANRVLESYAYPAFSQQAEFMSRVMQETGDHARGEDTYERLEFENKVRIKMIAQLNQNLEHMGDTPDERLARLNAYYESYGMYPTRAAWDMAAHELTKRLTGREPEQVYKIAIIALQTSKHPEVLNAAKTVWVQLHTQRLGADDDGAVFKEGLDATLNELTRNGVSPSLCHDLLKELADVTLMQPEAAEICGVYVENQLNRALTSWRTDGALRMFQSLQDISSDRHDESRSALRRKIVKFFAHDYDDALAEQLSHILPMNDGSRSSFLGFESYDHESKDEENLVRNITTAYLRGMHATLWEQLPEIRAAIFSQMLVPRSGKDANTGWRKATNTVLNIILPDDKTLDADGQKWRRWERLAFERFIVHSHPTERPLRLAIMLAIAKQNPAGATSDKRAGLQRVADLFNRLDAARRKFNQIVGSHPEMPEDLAEPFRKSTYMSQNPPRWTLFRHIKHVVPARVWNNIKRFGIVRGAASFYITTDIDYQDAGMPIEEDVISVLQRNALRGAKKGYKELELVFKDIARLEPEFAPHLPIALDMITQADNLANTETSLPAGLQQQGWMMVQMDGKSVTIDGQTFTRKVVPWKESGDEGKGVWKRMPRIKYGKRIDQLRQDNPDAADRAATAELVLTCRDNLAGTFDTDPNMGNRQFEGSTIHVYDVGGMVQSRPQMKDYMALSGVMANLGTASDPSTVIRRTIGDLKAQGQSSEFLTHVHRQMSVLGPTIAAIRPERLRQLPQLVMAA